MATELWSGGKVGRDQWLDVLFEKFGRQSLPYGLKVRPGLIKNGRQ